MKLPLRTWVGLVAVVLGVVVMVSANRLGRPPVAPAPPREVLRSDLALRENRLYARDEVQPFTGLMLEYYRDQALRSRSAVSNGMLHGASEGWYTNGVLQIREFFAAGVSHGLRTKWNPDGSRLSEAPIVEGKIHGTFRRWHPSGTMAEEVAMVNNEPDGLSLAYHTNGTLKARVRLAAGKVVGSETWNPGEGPTADPPRAAR